MVFMSWSRLVLTLLRSVDRVGVFEQQVFVTCVVGRKQLTYAVVPSAVTKGRLDSVKAFLGPYISSRSIDTARGVTVLTSTRDPQLFRFHHIVIVLCYYNIVVVIARWVGGWENNPRCLEPPVTSTRSTTTVLEVINPEIQREQEHDTY